MREADQTLWAVIDTLLLFEAALLGHYTGRALVILARRLRRAVTPRNHHREEVDGTDLRPDAGVGTEPPAGDLRPVRM